MEKKKKVPLFSQKFHSLRGKMTQEEFSKITGLSRPTIGFYERDERLPDAFTLKKIAEACNVSVDWLLDIKTDSLGGYERGYKDGYNKAVGQIKRFTENMNMQKE